MAIKFKAPKCKICGYAQRASSTLQWNKGNYACRCNSVDYVKATKYRKENPILEEHCDDLQNNAMRFTVWGPPAIKKNSPRITKMGNTISIRPSLLYEVWAAKAIKQLQDQWEAIKMTPAKGEIWMEAHFYRDTIRIADLSNLYEGIQDCLTTVGVWIDDSQIESHDGSRKHYDKNNPRIEVIIRKHND